MDYEFLIPIGLVILAVFNIINFIFFNVSKFQLTIFVLLCITSIIFGFIYNIKNIIYLSFYILVSTIGIFGLIIFISGLYLIRKYKGEPIDFKSQNFLKF
jgi:hypothetical protein